MAEHEVATQTQILEHDAHRIRNLADSIWDRIDDDLQDMAEDLVHTCEGFNNDADCDKCLDTMDKTKDEILKLVLDNMLGVDS